MQPATPKSVNIRVLKNLGSYPADTTVEVLVDHEGTPLDYFWRRRLRDAETDKCCEIVKTAKPRTTRPKESKS